MDLVVTIHWWIFASLDRSVCNFRYHKETLGKRGATTLDRLLIYIYMVICPQNVLLSCVLGE